MASCYYNLRFLLLLLVLTIAQCLNLPSFSNTQNAPLLFLPITKDVSTLQYLADICRGDSLSPTTLVVDIGSPYAWMDCGSFSDRRVVPRRSLKCLAAAKGPKPHQRRENGGDDKCVVRLENEIGELVEETVAVSPVDRSATEVLLFVCSTRPAMSLPGLSIGAGGVLGLGRGRGSLPSQVSSARSSDPQFTTCLSSSSGVVLVETGRFSSYFGRKISDSIVYTPLSTGQRDYSIGVKSIVVGGKKLSSEIKTTKLSTVVPYTTMRTPVYDKLTRAYERAALSFFNMTRTPPIGPFGLCFDSPRPNIPIGPEIDLVLQSELVKWRLSPRNLLVRVSENRVCLGVLDGGFDLEASIVLGGFQLEDMVLHFDLANSMLGFSPSLLTWQKSCSDFFNFESKPLVSL